MSILLHDSVLYRLSLVQDMKSERGYNNEPKLAALGGLSMRPLQTCWKDELADGLILAMTVCINVGSHLPTVAAITASVKTDFVTAQ